MAEQLSNDEIPRGRVVTNVQVLGARERVHETGESFAKALTEVANNLKGNMQLFTKQTALKVFAGVITGNPVDTGYSRYNWFFGVDSTNAILPMIDGAENYPEPDIQEAARTPNRFTYFLNNNLPYIVFLEAGSSNQQPTGFIANTLQRVGADVRGIRS